VVVINHHPSAVTLTQPPPPPPKVLASTGDVVLCHQKLAHRAGANGSCNIRYQVYFRISHVDHEALKKDGTLLEDLWCEFEGVKPLL
jgi:hypothetical protein